MAKRITTAATMLLLALTLGLGACDREDTASQRMETGGASDDAARGGTGVVSADPTEDPAAVDISLTEFEIRMPTILKPGSHLFRVKNAGAEPHSLTVEGNGMTVSLPTSAQPGETQALPVDLAPGTYRAFCPVDGHADRGMSVQFTVSE